MKKFKTQEIRDLLNQVYHEEISFSRMVEILNEMVSEVEKPNFKEGDFLHSDWDDENITIIFKKQAGDMIYYHASKSCYFGVTVDDDRYWRDENDFRHATEEEKQKLLDALAKECKRWNAEKLCVEDIPKRKFKKGDKVRIKDGVSSKTHKSVSPLFNKSMDVFIGTTMTVYKYTDRGGYVVCNESSWRFHEDWLEPYTNELKKGDLAIFWDDEPSDAVIRIYRNYIGEGVPYPHVVCEGEAWRNAVKFESEEQYKRLVKGEI